MKKEILFATILLASLAYTVVLFSAEAPTAIKPLSIEKLNGMGQETGEGLYYWDERTGKFLNIQKRLPAMEKIFIRLINKVNKVEKEHKAYKLETDFRIARLEIIMRKMHPDEDGFGN